MPSPSPPLHTLIIDDDEMSRDLLTVLLEAEGHTVHAAESGETALTHLSAPHHLYDIILIDMQMPGLTGTSLARQLREACGLHPLLLAISGSQPPAEELASYDGFLLKPFRMEAVEAAFLNRPHLLESHQSRTSSVTPQVFSLAASAQDASYQDMNLPHQQQDFLVPHSAEFPLNTGPDDVPVINEHIYHQLSASIPSPQLQEMYALCIKDARTRIAQMRKLVASQDSAQFIREAHAIKGGSGMLGATELHRLAASLEVNGLSPRHEIATDVNSLDELSSACDRLERILGSRV